MTWLLDGNVLVALAIDTHEFHERARRWFDAQTEPFATCAVTEGTLLRLHLRLAANRDPESAWEMPRAIHAMKSHEFWDDGFSYCALATSSIKGPGDVTDAWLAELARRRGGHLATLDRGIAIRHPDVGFMIPE
jgi:toxin-antitoxin system PIN domain toxin